MKDINFFSIALLVAPFVAAFFLLFYVLAA